MKLTKIPDSRVRFFTDNGDIADSFGRGKRYKSDPLNGTLDILTHPSRLAKNVELESPFGDCDDHAIYWCTTLLKSGIIKKAWFCFYTMIKKNSDELSGHAICVFQGDNGWYYWTDYNLPTCLMDGRHKWADASAKSYNATPVAAVMVEVKEIKEDDTPVFGEIEVLDILL